MGRKTFQRRPVKTRRHWRIPPPPLRNGDAPGPEGILILHDFDGAFGVLLWKTLRSLLLWGDTAEEEREELFGGDDLARREAEMAEALGGEGHALHEPLALLASILDPGAAKAGTLPDDEEIGLACTEVARWADQQGYPQTSIEFYQAAAVVCPSNPRFALAVMRAARDLAHYSRAEAWFHRSMGLARQSRDWDTYTRAYLAHGTMMRRRGALPAARRSYLKALRRASRQGLREARSMALHDLFVLEEYSGAKERADQYAADAADAYGSGHPSLPLLAHDVAVAWLQDGDFDAALRILEKVFPLLADHGRTVALGSLARASAGVGDDAGYQRFRRELGRIPPGPGVAEAWVEVARGALLLGNRDEARTALRRGEDLARHRREGQIRFMAESMFEAIAAEEAAHRNRRGETTPAEAEDPRQQLAERFALLLAPMADELPTVPPARG